MIEGDWGGIIAWDIINSIIIEGDCYFKWTALLHPI